MYCIRAAACIATVHSKTYDVSSREVSILYVGALEVASRKHGVVESHILQAPDAKEETGALVSQAARLDVNQRSPQSSLYLHGGALEIHAVDHGVGEIHVIKLGVLRIRLAELRLLEVGAPEISITQDRPRQVEARGVLLLHVALAEVVQLVPRRIRLANRAGAESAPVLRGSPRHYRPSGELQECKDPPCRPDRWAAA
eukprot:scaffold7362_cov266-Pinguiococcus_pyrenoidosus.AAC.32